MDGFGEVSLQDVTAWDVATWAMGPPRPYRINTLYRLDGAVVTVTGRCDTPEAAADLAAALHVFEPLGAALYVDLCHATLDERAAGAVVDAGRRRPDGRGMQVRNAEPATHARLRTAEQQRDLRRSGPASLLPG